jgi:hypothetical protein
MRLICNYSFLAAGFTSEMLQSKVPHGVCVTVLSHINHVTDCLSTVLNIPTKFDMQPFGTYDSALISPSSDRSRPLSLCPVAGMPICRPYDEGIPPGLRAPSSSDEELPMYNPTFATAVDLLQTNVVGLAMDMVCLYSVCLLPLLTASADVIKTLRESLRGNCGHARLFF